MSIKDIELESEILALLSVLERSVDYIGPTPLRHDMSEGIVAMRRLMKNFSETEYEMSECDPRYI